ncbi:MAG: EamA family transporter [Sulfurimicrobium sp.]|nr:EamA family transporter [Sulfurimicrobium sp.]
MKFKDILLATLVAVLWGSAFVVIEIGLKEIPPIFNASLRFMVASIPFVFFIGRKAIPWRWIVSIGATFICLFSLMYVGMKMGMPAGLTSLVLQSQVLFAVALAAIIFRDIPGMMHGMGLILGISGVAIIASTMVGSGTMAALAFVIGAAFFYGLISILMKLAGRVNMLSLIVWASLIPPLPLLALSMILETGQLNAAINISALGLFSILYTAIFGTIIPFAIWGRLLRTYSTQTVAPFSLLVPIFGMFLASILLDESFGETRLYAAALILFGLALIIAGQKMVDTLRVLLLRTQLPHN